MCSAVGNPGSGTGTATSWITFQSALFAAITTIDRDYITISRYNYRKHRATGTALYERAYCYELYHQLRNALGSRKPPFTYTVHGELSKLADNSTTQRLTRAWMTLSTAQSQSRSSRRRPASASGRGIRHRSVRGFIPDFIVHRAGSPDNLVVMEVKSSTSIAQRPGSAAVDIRKLAAFVDSGGLGYYKGIFLVFGDRPPLITNPALVPSNIDILWHEPASHRPIVIHSQGQQPVSGITNGIRLPL